MRFRRAMRLSKQLERRISDIIATLIENVMEDENDIWDEVARLFDYDDLHAILDAKRSLKINWQCSRAELYRPPDESVDKDEVNESTEAEVVRLRCSLDNIRHEVRNELRSSNVTTRTMSDTLGRILSEARPRG